MIIGKSQVFLLKMADQLDFMKESWVKVRRAWQEWKKA